MRRLMLSTIALCLLSACASGAKPTPRLAPVEPIRVLPPASLLQAPQTLPDPASGRMRDLERNHLAVTQAYHLLANQMCSLILYLSKTPPPGCAPWLP